MKSLNQNLEDQIKNSKNDERSPYRSDNDFEEDIKHLNNIIKHKYSTLAQDQKKLEDQDSDICQHQQHQEKLQQKYDDIKKTHKL